MTQLRYSNYDPTFCNYNYKFYLIHENLRLVFYSVLSVIVDGRVRIRRTRRQELGAGEREARLELGQIAVLHFKHFFVIVLISQHLKTMDIIL